MIYDKTSSFPSPFNISLRRNVNPQLFRNIHKLIACSAHFQVFLGDLRTQYRSKAACKKKLRIEITCSFPSLKTSSFSREIGCFKQLYNLTFFNRNTFWYHSISPNISNNDPSKLKPFGAIFFPKIQTSLCFFTSISLSSTELRRPVTQTLTAFLGICDPFLRLHMTAPRST